MTLRLTFLGYHWPWGGDLFDMRHPNGNRARVYVDSIGKTWVDVRRIPEGGFFHSERVSAWRSFGGSDQAERQLHVQGFTDRRNSQYAHSVRERD